MGFIHWRRILRKKLFKNNRIEEKTKLAQHLLCLRRNDQEQKSINCRAY